ncbi:MAG: hypothetical protein ACFFDF_08640 [Candidatus Odinarchaeota archaeon]
MNLEFQIHELKEGSRFYEKLCKDKPNEFIIVGECKIGLKVQQVDDNGICLLGGCMLDEFSFYLDQNDLKPTNTYVTFDTNDEIYFHNGLKWCAFSEDMQVEVNREPKQR